ncbi:Uncharacterised protein [Yersinia enterocolitica]|nr:Uncharacterised protein [Yersinia enterocolitica]
MKWLEIFVITASNERIMTLLEYLVLGVMLAVFCSKVREICRLPEYAARMKPVIPDYEWITYGERVSNEALPLAVGLTNGEQIKVTLRYLSIQWRFSIRAITLKS